MPYFAAQWHWNRNYLKGYKCPQQKIEHPSIDLIALMPLINDLSHDSHDRLRLNNHHQELNYCCLVRRQLIQHQLLLNFRRDHKQKHETCVTLP
jgi:hypothetical protein